MEDGDELFPNGIFVFNITKMLAVINDKPGLYPLETITVREAFISVSRINKGHANTVDLTFPVILAEITPGQYNPTVSPDPDDPHFGFSFAGTAFFVVGLHPHSSREARCFRPLLVFNPHAQFMRLREAGRWARMQEVIRTREMELQGSLNPNLADHGDVTEARQYSGRQVEPNWDPPFEAQPTAEGCPFAHPRPDDQR